jgi:HEAT repeat protein
MTDDPDITNRITRLIETFRSESEFDRQFTERSLLVIGVPAVEPLLRAVDDDAMGVRFHAVNALGDIGDQRATEALYRRLTDDDFDVGIMAAHALARLGGVSASRLTEDLHASEAQLRSMAARALGELADRDAVMPLIEQLQDSVPDVRWYAAGALGKIGDLRAVESLIAALGDASDSVRFLRSGCLGETWRHKGYRAVIAIATR